MYRRILVVIVDRCHHHLEEKMKKMFIQKPFLHRMKM